MTARNARVLLVLAAFTAGLVLFSEGDESGRTDGPLKATVVVVGLG